MVDRAGAARRRVRDGRSDPDRAVATADGWVSEFEIGIRSAMDREESKKTSDRMLDVRRPRGEGRPAAIAGRRVFGYTRLSETVAEEAALILEAADRVLAGESVWGICTDWNDAKLASVTGGRGLSRPSPRSSDPGVSPGSADRAVS